MNNTTSRKLERSVFTSFFQDGSIEAVTGLILLEIGLIILLSRYAASDLLSGVMVLPAAFLVLGAIVVLRRYKVIPRLGSVKFTQERRRRLSKFAVIPIFVLIAGVLLSLTGVREAEEGRAWVTLLPVSLTPLFVFSIAAYYLDMKRLYIYGSIVGLILPLGKYLETVIVSAVVLPALCLGMAVLFLIAAGFVFATFLRRYPPVEVSESG